MRTGKSTMYHFTEFYDYKKLIENNFKAIKDISKIAEIIVNDKNLTKFHFESADQNTELMNNNGIKKMSGISMVVLNDKFQWFGTETNSNPHIKEIHEKLQV